MAFVWGIAGAIIGLIIGGMVGNDEGATVGLLCGAIAGVLLARQGALSARLQRAEAQLADLWSARAQAEIDAPIRVAAAAPIPVAPSQPPAVPLRTPAPSIDGDVLDLGAVPNAPRPPPQVTPAPIFGSEPDVARETAFDRAVASIKNWFTEGNVPVKVGMLVLFAGVAALLKYAADEGWLTLPIELRLTGIALAGIAALAFGWRQRESRRAFALSLQGGAIGVLLLTVFAAFRLYSLLPAGAAFALMLVLIAGVGLLAALQDALALAVLGILAGFAAPILLSTGSSNHVFLFGYYALLNVAIFAIAWVRPWRALNLLGFFFTYAIATAWGVLKYQSTLFASTEPFLLVYFAVYLAIPILYAFRRAPERRDAIDGTLIFGNPLVAFALQAALLDGDRMSLALSALALGLVYLVLAWALIRRARVLGESFAVLALGFSTLAVPLALSARVTGCVFALEGAALIWLGLRQQRRLPQWSGLLLQLLAAGAFAWATMSFAGPGLPFANGSFIGATLIAIAAFVSAFLYLRASESNVLTHVLYFWGLLWWVGALFFEIERSVPFDVRAEAMLAAVAATMWLAAEAWRRLHRAALEWTGAVGFWLAVPLAPAIAYAGQTFGSWGLAAFAAYAAYALFGWRTLTCLRERKGAVAAFAHIGWLWSWTVLLSLLLSEVASTAGFASGWQMAFAWLPVIAMHVLALRTPALIAPPLSASFAHHRGALLITQACVLALFFVRSLFASGASSPLPFLPIINPLELTQLAALVVVALWARDADAPAAITSRRPMLLAAAGFAFVTAATLRAVHHLAGIAWDDGIITATVSQTSLAVVWSVLGVIGWVIGSRRGNRPLWLAGALLMAVVLVKLLLIDRQHLGNLFGIASFIAYGLLCTLIGYLAPAPPRQLKPATGDAA